MSYDFKLLEYFQQMKQKKAANYLLVALKNGKVVVSLHGRRKEDLVSAGNVNDGHWHRVHIVKDKRKVVVMLDDFAPLRAKAPNKLQLDGQLFVGGLPESSPLLQRCRRRFQRLHPQFEPERSLSRSGQQQECDPASGPVFRSR